MSWRGVRKLLAQTEIPPPTPWGWFNHSTWRNEAQFKREWVILLLCGSLSLTIMSLHHPKSCVCQALGNTDLIPCPVFLCSNSGKVRWNAQMVCYMTLSGKSLDQNCCILTGKPVQLGMSQLLHLSKRGNDQLLTLEPLFVLKSVDMFKWAKSAHWVTWKEFSPTGRREFEWPLFKKTTVNCKQNKSLKAENRSPCSIK